MVQWTQCKVSRDWMKLDRRLLRAGLQHWDVHCQGRQGVRAFSKDGQGISFHCTVLYCSSAFWCRVCDTNS